jgi:putative addiction module killer protein
VNVNTLLRTDEFDDWLRGLKDIRAKARIYNRLDGVIGGNFGDCKAVGDGVSEMRIHYGSGYRLYFSRRGSAVYLLLLGGDKSTQVKDIERAKSLLKSLPKE